MAQSSLETFGAQYLDRLLAEANVVYEGTVTDVNASSVAALQASERTVLTRVDTAFVAPSGLPALDGQTVTLYSENAASLAVEARYVFFTQSWLLGEQIAVRELGRVEVTQADELRRQIQSSRDRLDEGRLSARLRAADLVLVGKVTRIEAAPSSPSRGASEHDPQWRLARIEVRSLLKGNPASTPVKLLFPGTMDVAWVDAPRPRTGQEAVLLLTFDEDLQAYTALDPLDVQPVDRADRIRQLIERERRQ